MHIFRVLTLAALLSGAAHFLATGTVVAGGIHNAQAAGDDDEVWTDEDDGVSDEDDGVSEEPDPYWGIPEDEMPDSWTDEPELPIDIDVLLMVSADEGSGGEHLRRCCPVGVS